jgi:hypothetical protein
LPGGVSNLRTATDSAPFRCGLSHSVRIEYSTNIQIAELNALNAALAVIKWKKLAGFYQDLDFEHHCSYTIGGNMLRNEDVLAAAAGQAVGDQP